MKNNVWVVVVLMLAALFVLEFRYMLVIDSPVVAKIDRITGDVWIANSGMWLKVQHCNKELICPTKGREALPGISEKLAETKTK